MDRNSDREAVLREVTYRESGIRGRIRSGSGPLEREDCLTKSHYRQREQHSNCTIRHPHQLGRG